MCVVCLLRCAIVVLVSGGVPEKLYLRGERHTPTIFVGWQILLRTDAR